MNSLIGNYPHHHPHPNPNIHIHIHTHSTRTHTHTHTHTHTERERVDVSEHAFHTFGSPGRAMLFPSIQQLGLVRSAHCRSDTIALWSGGHAGAQDNGDSNCAIVSPPRPHTHAHVHTRTHAQGVACVLTDILTKSVSYTDAHSTQTGTCIS